MSDNSNIDNGGNKPQFIAYAVIERGEGKKSKWREIGVAFRHQDQKGFDVLIDAVPMNGRITLRLPDANK
jgi:hypothetical protein